MLPTKFTGKSKRWGKKVTGWYVEVEGRHFLVKDNAGLRYHECPDGILGIAEVIPETLEANTPAIKHLEHSSRDKENTDGT